MYNINIFTDYMILNRDYTLVLLRESIRESHLEPFGDFKRSSI